MRENAENDPILIGFWGKKYQTKFIKIHLWALSKEKKTAMLLQPWLLMRENAQMRYESRLKDKRFFQSLAFPSHQEVFCFNLGYH